MSKAQKPDSNLGLLLCKQQLSAETVTDRNTLTAGHVLMDVATTGLAGTSADNARRRKEKQQDCKW
jgi:hypothetical protein